MQTFTAHGFKFGIGGYRFDGPGGEAVGNRAVAAVIAEISAMPPYRVENLHRHWLSDRLGEETASVREMCREAVEKAARGTPLWTPDTAMLPLLFLERA